MDYLVKSECFRLFNENNKTSKNIILEDKIKLFNWFNVKLDKINYLCCKAKSLNDDKKEYYFYFNDYQYFMCLENEIEKFKNITKFIDEYNIGSYDLLKDFKELQVNNVNKLISFDKLITNDYISDEIDVYNNVYLIKCLQNQRVSLENTIISQSFKQRWFYILNNIKPASTYEININVSNFFDVLSEKIINKNISKVKKENHYFVHDEDVLKMFSIKLLQDSTNITKLSFDIECQTESGFPVAEKNRITHIGIIVDNPVHPQKNKYFCLITNDLLSPREDQENQKTYDQEELTTRDVIKIYNDNIIYKFMSERNLLIFTKYILEHTQFDYVITYNGNFFDIPYINGRLQIYGIDEIKSINCFNELNLNIQDRKLNYSGKSTSYKILKNNNNIIYFDMYNHVKTNYLIDNYSLNFFSQMNFKLNMSLKYCTPEDKKDINVTSNIKIIKIEPIDPKKYEDIKDVPKNILLFYKTIRTASYCFINNVTYLILNKKNIIKNINELYNSESILNSINQPFYIYPLNDIENKLKILLDKEEAQRPEREAKGSQIIETVCLSKDAIEIFDKDAYKDYDYEKAIVFANYCMHDSILPTYLFEIENIHYKITANSNSYFISQAESFIYKNSSNCLGIMLNELMEIRHYIKKTKTIDFGEFIGGRVFEPKDMYNIDPIYSFDFQSLYPNLMILHNTSPEKIELIIYSKNYLEIEKIKILLEEKYKQPYFDICICKIEKTNGTVFVVFNKKTIGFISNIVKKGLAERLEYKKLMKTSPENRILFDTMQLKVKERINSVYGLLGSKYFLFSCKFCALSITTFGREKLEFLHNIIHNSRIFNKQWYPNKIKHIYDDCVIKDSYELSNIKTHNEFYFKVIYGDTDSTMIRINCPDITDCALIGDSFGKILNKDILNNTILLELENIYLNMIITKKKKYSCFKIDVDDIFKISDNSDIQKYMIKVNKGTSLVRRDYTFMHKNYMSIVLEYINQKMKERNIVNLDDQIIKLVNKLINEELTKFWNTIDNQGAILRDYILSMEYNQHTKSKEYFTHKKVKDFNDNPLNMNKISGGDRFYYIYIVHYNEEENRPDKNILDNLNWNSKNLLDIQSKLYIVDVENFNIPDNYRIALEIYFNRFLSDVTNYIQNKDKMKKLENIYFGDFKIKNNIIVDEYDVNNNDNDEQFLYF